jgi:hypothetical protein
MAMSDQQTTLHDGTERPAPSTHVLTARELAARFGPKVKPHMIYRMAAAGKIPWLEWGEKGRGRRFVEADVRAALARSQG